MHILEIFDWWYCQPFFGRVFHSLSYCLRKELSDCDSVLDLGCGSESPIKGCKVRYKVGVDLSENDLKESIKKKIHDRYLLKDISSLKFKSKSFDAVITIGVIEHLEKEEAMKLIPKIERWSIKKTIISTPNGYLPQEAEPNNPFQLHRSGWKIDEMRKMEYKVYGMAGWKKLRRPSSNDDKTVKKMLDTVKFRPRLFWLIVAVMSELIVYHFPSQAYELFCVKIQKK